MTDHKDDPDTAISLRAVSKEYPSAEGTLRALDALDLEIPRGVVFGVLGPNGAGKTTALEIAVGLRRQTSGRVRVLGLDPTRDAAEVRRRVGVQPQEVKLFEFLTVEEILDIWSTFYDSSARPAELLASLRMESYRGERIGKLSGGQRQRVNVALALVGKPDLIVLDEPSTGLDPVARRDLWNLVRELRASGVSVVLSTHSMEEAESLCDLVAIIDRGTCLVTGTPDELVSGVQHGQSVEFSLAQPLSPSARTRLDELGELCVIEQGSRGRLMTHDSDAALALLTRLSETKDIAVRRNTLSDVFFAVTGREFDDIKN